jgi:hypothetical protein
MSDDEYQRILLQVIRELKSQGWSDEDIAECDIRIRETDDPDAPLMVSELMADTDIKYKLKGVYKR